MSLAQHGLDTGDIAPDLPHPGRILELAVRTLEAQIEDLPAEDIELLGQLIIGLGPQTLLDAQA